MAQRGGEMGNGGADCLTAIPAFYPAIPALSSVIPAKAGIHMVADAVIFTPPAA